MNTALVVVLIVAWIAVGLGSGLWMARHGHDPLWTLIAVVLGPLFVPIAIERVQRSPGVARFGSKGAPPQRPDGKTELRVLAGGIEIAGAVHTEVLAGAPGPTLRGFAEQQDIDLLVVGRRGKGLSTRLLGSVSADIIQHSPVPVLVIEPDGPTDRRSQRHRTSAETAAGRDTENT